MSLATASAWSFFDAATGEPRGVYTGAARWLELNTPAGCIARPGRAPAGHGLDIATGQLVPLQPSADELGRQARARRDAALAACDWVSLRAADTGQPIPAPWQAYRQALRDLPGLPGWPTDITWPMPPA